jgi:hypothetical protein
MCDAKGVAESLFGLGVAAFWWINPPLFVQVKAAEWNRFL